MNATADLPSVRIFVGHSSKDGQWLDPNGKWNLAPWLKDQLARFDNAEVIVWVDTRLKDDPGVDWERRIEKEIDDADIAILLVSQYFISSPFISTKELPRIRERAENEGLLIIPILVGPIDWEFNKEGRWLNSRQVIPGDPTPLQEYALLHNADWDKVRVELLQKVTKKIYEALAKRDLPCPDRLAARALTQSEVELNWRNHADEQTSVRIERRSERAEWREICVVPSRPPQYLDRSLTPGTSYNYRLQAVWGKRQSVFSNLATVNTHSRPNDDRKRPWTWPGGLSLPSLTLWAAGVLSMAALIWFLVSLVSQSIKDGSGVQPTNVVQTFPPLSSNSLPPLVPSGVPVEPSPSDGLSSLLLTTNQAAIGTDARRSRDGEWGFLAMPRCELRLGAEGMRFRIHREREFVDVPWSQVKQWTPFKHENSSLLSVEVTIGKYAYSSQVAPMDTLHFIVQRRPDRDRVLALMRRYAAEVEDRTMSGSQTPQGPTANPQAQAFGALAKEGAGWAELRVPTNSTKREFVSLAISASGEFLATSIGDRSVLVWTRTKDNPVAHIENLPFTLRSMSFSHDDRLLAGSGGTNTILVWRTADWKLHSSLEKSVLGVQQVAFAPWSNGVVLAACNANDSVNLWTLSNPPSEPELLAFDPAGLRTMAFSRDGDWLALGGNRAPRGDFGGVEVWSPRNRPTKVLSGIGTHQEVSALAFSPSGRWLGFGNANGEISIYDLSDKRTVLTRRRAHDFSIKAICFSPDEVLMVTISALESQILVWNARTRMIVARLFGHTGIISGTAFLPEGNSLVSAGRDGTVRVWDLSKLKL